MEKMKMGKDISTEEKIKKAARKIFRQKGYASTRTRDIAEEAGINLALLNYYFRSKEKLFEMVMAEGLNQLFSLVRSIMAEENATLSQKVDALAAAYIDMLLENPNLPIFVLGEIQANPEKFKAKLGINRKMVTESGTFHQLHAQLQKTGMNDLNPFHIILNMLSMTLFPFIGKPMIQRLTEMDDHAFRDFVNERKILIPIWIKNMLQIRE
ncbi:MAG: TetR/AcrR family transcriptional regulator [Bacteroidales bacterium]|jgi:AcrR family transcriptional regulator|nr:TetR/AcrR family transcriptional regulator [Bacteroidales bacterium]